MPPTDTSPPFAPIPRESAKSPTISANVQQPAGLTVAAATAAALGAATPARAAYAGFPDLDAGAWYVTGGTVDWSNEHGVVNGFPDGTWGPDATLSRAQGVAILCNYEGGDGKGVAEPFDDVTDGAWYKDAVAWAAANGVTDG